MKTAALLLLLIAVSFGLQCGKGGIQDGQGNCHYPKYIEGCLQYSADHTCASCEYNYQLVSGFCIYTPNTQGLDCCSQFDNSSICASCSKGLYLNPATKLCEDKKIQGCLIKSINGCSVCALNFDLVGSICVKSVQGCTSYDQSLSCLSCNSSYQFFQGICIPLVQIGIIANCKYINQFGCAECNSGFRLNTDGSCSLPSIAGCLVLGSSGVCSQCESPFYQLQNNGQCAVIGCLQYNGAACTQCNSALGFALNNQRCQIQSCIYFDSKGCKACQNGLVAGSWGCRTNGQKVCLICKSDEFMGTDNQCHKKDIHCSKYQNGVCVSCIDAFYLDQNGICQQKQYGCIYSNGVCNSCSAPFTFSSGSCVIYGCTQYSYQGCATCDSRLQLSNYVCGLPNCKQLSGFVCTVCYDGYQLNSNKVCVSIDVNCDVRNALNVCLKCKEGYQFDKNGLCVTAKLGCNYVDGICTSCRAPFIYVPSSQTCVIDGCSNYFIGGCSVCSSGYTLLYNSCKLPNCLTSSNGKCLQCDPDYVFTSQGVCVSKDQFCDKMDEFGTCIKCMSSYYYSQVQKKCIKRVSGCIYDDKGICYSCYAPFTFNNGQCVILGCSSYFENGCDECAYPFQLTTSKTCEIAHCNAYKQGICVGCSQGYALSKKGLCLAQDPYCLNYNIEQTQCQSCIKGYRFDENRRCEYADEHCWDFDQSGICMNCDRIYFLNPYGKCQLRDPQCTTYSSGYCIQCRQYNFVNGGVCFANLKGCKTQQSYNKCLVCDSGYDLENGVCKTQITQLSWNSVDMDFFDDDNQDGYLKSQSTFTTQFTTTNNLVQALAAGAQVFFSSSSINNAQFQVDSQGSSGWSPVGQSEGAFVGLQTTNLQTFYAVDVKVLTGSSLTIFTLEYSMEGKSFIKIGDFDLSGVIIGSVKTFYFKPVYAKFIRIVVKQGTPNIKFEFYFSSAISISHSSSDGDTYIGKSVATSIDAAGAQGGISTCGQTGLCWAGVQACEPRKLAGFSLVYSNSAQNDVIQAVKIDYSMDGISFTHWSNDQEFALTNNGFTFPTPLLAQKVHIHFSKYQGSPRFGIKFVWADA